MIKKTFDILKVNSPIYTYFLVFLIGAFIFWNTLFPGTYGIFGGLTALSVIFGLIYLVSIVLFASGYGSMLAEVIKDRGNPENEFKPGIKKYFGRTLSITILYGLAFLVVLAVLSLVLYVLMVIFAPYSGISLRVLSTQVIAIAAIFTLPFIMPGYASLFIDSARVGQAFGKGIRLGGKKYAGLVTLSFCLFTPSFVLTGLRNLYRSFGGNNLPPLYLILSYLAAAAIGLFVVIEIFLLYNREKGSLEKSIPAAPQAICPQCNSGNPAEAQFCLRCGYRLNNVKYCPACGGQNSPQAAFCKHCANKFQGGAPQPQVAQTPFQAPAPEINIETIPASREAENQEVEQQTVIPTDNNENEPADYVEKCLLQKYSEADEKRTYKSDWKFMDVLEPLNSQKYDDAISKAGEVLSTYSDFDLVYKWLGSAYRGKAQFVESRDVLLSGLSKAKRKSLLLTDLGETEWRLGNLENAVYWWAQALHCLSTRPVDCGAYLLLSYVSDALGLKDASARFIARVDSMRPGQVRLDPATARKLTELVQGSDTRTVIKVIEALDEKYLKRG